MGTGTPTVLSVQPDKARPGNGRVRVVLSDRSVRVTIGVILSAAGVSDGSPWPSEYDGCGLVLKRGDPGF